MVLMAHLSVTSPVSMVQYCPFCNNPNPRLVCGLVRNPENNYQVMIIPSKGYSFCRCKDIFYTRWDNIDQSVYDENYIRGYTSPEVDILFSNYGKVYFPKLKENNPDIKSFMEIGCVNHTVLDRAKEQGWETFAVDINPNIDFGQHEKIICDVEKLKLDRKFDVIWASHIFEHFQHPLKVLDNLRDALTDKGQIFIAMPDTGFIDLLTPYNWTHWILKEHYILWNVDGFVRETEKRGFKCRFKTSNNDVGFICGGDFHTVFQKEPLKVVMPNAQAENCTNH